jgi:predicted RNase H-like HicB family nuclease
MMSTMETSAHRPQQLHVHVRVEDGSLWATVDEFPGVFAMGDDYDELRESLEEAIALWLAAPGEEPPPIRLASLEPTETTASAELVYA